VRNWPEQLNIDRHFLRDRLAEGRGERIALRLDDRLVTYSDVDRTASGFAQLLKEAGVQREDRVLVVMPDGLGFVAALFGIFRIGAVGVMLNPGLTKDAMASIVGRSRAAATIVHENHLDHYHDAASDGNAPPADIVITLEMELPDIDVETADTLASDPALWLFSGGTTGSPKAVVQSHRSFANTTELYGKGSLGYTEQERVISVPKLYFGYATGCNLFFPFSVGASSILFEGPSTPEALFERIENHQATVLVTVPSAINQMLQHHATSPREVPTLRLATSAGEALPETLYHQWKTAFGVELLDGLGTAEMWHVFVTNTVDDVKPGTLGKVVPGFELQARDEDGVSVEPGEVGRLWVKGESIGLEYWEEPDKSTETFRDPWVVGGDLISIDDDGYVTHRGRADDAIKVKGKWFRPQEVESALLDHPAVKDCAVIAVSDEAGLAKPVGFVVAGGDVEEQELIDWVLARVEPYKHPRRVYIVDELPQTHLGKVDRTALKHLARP
jgi:benzoate-CoA ligase family protein